MPRALIPWSGCSRAPSCESPLRGGIIGLAAGLGLLVAGPLFDTYCAVRSEDECLDPFRPGTYLEFDAAVVLSVTTGIGLLVGSLVERQVWEPLLPHDGQPTR